MFSALTHVFPSVSLSDIKKERPSTPDDDVIVLSDNEPSSPCMNGVSYSFKKTDTEMLMVTMSCLFDATYQVLHTRLHALNAPFTR